MISWFFLTMNLCFRASHTQARVAEPASQNCWGLFTQCLCDFYVWWPESCLCNPIKAPILLSLKKRESPQHHHHHHYQAWEAGPPLSFCFWAIIFWGGRDGSGGHRRAVAVWRGRASKGLNFDGAGSRRRPLHPFHASRYDTSAASSKNIKPYIKMADWQEEQQWRGRRDFLAAKYRTSMRWRERETTWARFLGCGGSRLDEIQVPPLEAPFLLFF